MVTVNNETELPTAFKEKKVCFFNTDQGKINFFIKFCIMVIQVKERDCQPRQRTRKKARRLKKRREWR